MKTIAHNKKVWEKPAIDLMNIKRDTFSGSGNKAEGVDGDPGQSGKNFFPRSGKSRGARP